jgi:hypothetical protein
MGRLCVLFVFFFFNIGMIFGDKLGVAARIEPAQGFRLYGF